MIPLIDSRQYLVDGGPQIRIRQFPAATKVDETLEDRGRGGVRASCRPSSVDSGEPGRGRHGNPSQVDQQHDEEGGEARDGAPSTDSTQASTSANAEFIQPSVDGGLGERRAALRTAFTRRGGAEEVVSAFAASASADR
jgi:hypothetical protein